MNFLKQLSGEVPTAQVSSAALFCTLFVRLVRFGQPQAEQSFSSRGPVFRYLSDHSAQLMKIEWLGYHPIHAERFVGRSILRRQMRRKHENLSAKGCIANPSHEFDSGHPGHIVV